MVNILLKNDSSTEARYWSVRDENSGVTLFTDQLFQPNQVVQRTVTASGAGFGRIAYKHSQGANWIVSGLLQEGETVNMY